MDRRVRPEFANPDRFKKMTEFEKMLELMRVSDLVPHLVGEKGIGKSSKVKSYAKRMGMGYVKVEFSNVDRVDFNGLLKFFDYIQGEGNETLDKVIEYMKQARNESGDKGSIAYHTHTVPKWVIEILENYVEGKPTLLFFDEVNRAPLDVINAIMNTILEREYGSDRLVLPPTTFIVTAGNPDTEEYTVNPMDSALKGRVVEVEMTASFEEWRKNFAARMIEDELLVPERVKDIDEKNVDKLIHPVVIQYLEENPQEFMLQGEDDPKTGEKKAGLDPRRWEMISNLLKGYELTTGNDSDKYMGVLRIALESLAGTAVSSKLFNFYKDNKRLTLDKLLKRVKPELNKVKEAENPEDEPLKKAIDKARQVYDSLEIIQKKQMLDTACEKYYNGHLSDKELALIFAISPTEHVLAVSEGDDDISKKAAEALEKLDGKYNMKMFKKFSNSLKDAMQDESMIFEELLSSLDLEDLEGNNNKPKK